MIDPEIKMQTVNTTGNTLFGGVMYTLTLNEWVAVATLVYLVLQIILLYPKYRDMFKSRHKK